MIIIFDKTAIVFFFVEHQDSDIEPHDEPQDSEGRIYYKIDHLSETFTR